MSKIVIGFSRPKKWKLLSSLIMLGENTDYSHVYIRFYSSTYARELVYQASGLAVNFMSFDLFKHKNAVVDEFEIEVSEETAIEIVQFCIDNAGIPYGIKQFLGIGILKLGKLLRLKLGNPFRDGRQTYICSEIASYIIRDFMSMPITENLDDMSPKAVHAVIRAHASTP